MVLDVGTGTGALMPDIRKYRPGHIYACDLSSKMLEQVAKRYPEVERHQCDIRDLDLPDACVDVVFMNGMYGNIADKPGALRNIMRMLRPGGRIVISHPEGRGFVEGLVRSEPFPITALPSQDEAHTFLGSYGLTGDAIYGRGKIVDLCRGQATVGMSDYAPAHPTCGAEGNRSAYPLPRACPENNRSTAGRC